MIETRGAELRYQPGRRLVGTPMVYRREARVTLRDGRAVTERFAAFAFSDYLRSGAATRLNMMHDPSIVVASTGPLPGRGKLELRDTPDDLKMIATLPSGDPYDRVLDLVRDGSAAELSVEFRSLEQRIEGDRRTVLQATLPAVGIVDRGAYPQPVEVRARGRGLVGRPEYNRPRVTSDRGTTRKELFSPGAFRYALEDEGREILLQIGDDAGQVLASRRAGTLTLKDTPAALLFEVEELPNTSYARDFAALLEAETVAAGVLPFFRIPPADVVPDAERLEPDDENPDVMVRVARGNPGEIERRVLTPAPRRRRPWL